MRPRQGPIKRSLIRRKSSKVRLEDAPAALEAIAIAGEPTDWPTLPVEGGGIPASGVDLAAQPFVPPPLRSPRTAGVTRLTEPTPAPPQLASIEQLPSVPSSTPGRLPPVVDRRRVAFDPLHSIGIAAPPRSFSPATFEGHDVAPPATVEGRTSSASAPLRNPLHHHLSPLPAGGGPNRGEAVVDSGWGAPLRLRPTERDEGAPPSEWDGWALVDPPTGEGDREGAASTTVDVSAVDRAAGGQLLDDANNTATGGLGDSRLIQPGAVASLQMGRAIRRPPNPHA